MIKKLDLIENECFNDLVNLFNSYRVFYGEESDIEKANTFIRERIIKKESIIYIAVENKITVGFTQLYPIFTSTKMKRLWLLNDLYVIEDYRNKGIATQLIDKVKSLCVETDAWGILLETSIQNVEANNLYVKQDFKVDKHANYYFWKNLK